MTTPDPAPGPCTCGSTETTRDRYGCVACALCRAESRLIASAILTTLAEILAERSVGADSRQSAA